MHLSIVSFVCIFRRVYAVNPNCYRYKACLQKSQLQIMILATCHRMLRLTSQLAKRRAMLRAALGQRSVHNPLSVSSAASSAYMHFLDRCIWTWGIVTTFVSIVEPHLGLKNGSSHHLIRKHATPMA